MRNDIGIFNSKSYQNEYKRALQNTPVARGVRTTVTLADLESLAVVVAARLEVAFFHGDAVRMREYKQQLALIEIAKTGVQ